MKSYASRRSLCVIPLCVLFLVAAPLVSGQRWVSFDDNTRYIALGDSLSAGYAAMPVTQGFVFQLYQMGAIDKLNNLHFCAAAVPGAMSSDVLKYQVPQVGLFFKETGVPYRKVVTLTVGGNDAFSVVAPDGTVDMGAVTTMLGNYGKNLAAILGTLTAMGDVKVYVGNLYDPKLPISGAELIVQAMNQVIEQVAAAFPGKVFVVDVYAAFSGRNGLLLSEKRGSAPDESHPSDAGYRVMARAFADAIGKP